MVCISVQLIPLAISLLGVIPKRFEKPLNTIGVTAEIEQLRKKFLLDIIATSIKTLTSFLIPFPALCLNSKKI